MPIDPPTAAALLAYAAVVLLPGLAVLDLARVRTSDSFVRLGLGVGVGLALEPLAYLWPTLAGLAVTARVWWVVLALSAVVVAAGAWRRRWTSDRGPGPTGPDRPRPAWPALALVGLLAIVTASRWWAVREVGVPLWGDSLHHAMIARLIGLAHGVPTDWQPLAALSSFTYHFGLHAGVATLAALTGLPEHRALLVAGQALSMLQPLTCYALAAGLTGRPWAGVAAALAAGGLSPMPAWYVNWGRYTQLAGQVILPAAALAAASAAAAAASRPGATDVEGEAARAAPGSAARYDPGRADGLGAVTGSPAGRMRRRGVTGGRAGPIAVAGLLAAGLALTHYLVLAFLLLFLAALWLASPGDRRPAALRLTVVLALALALVAPWLPRLADSIIARAAAAMLSGGLSDPDVYGVVAPSAIWGSVESLQAHVGLALACAAGLAAAVGVWRRDRLGWTALSWIGLLFLAAYPAALGLPVTAPIKDFTLAIGLYVPASLLIGAAVGAVRGAAAGSGRRFSPSRGAREAGPALAAVAVITAAGACGWRDARVVQAGNVLVTPADERAMEWIRGNTPVDAVFLVGCVEAFADTVCAGDDAGWWIPVLAERRTTVPPITYSLEETGDPDLVGDTNELADLWRSDIDAPDTLAALAAAGVTHAYAGVVGGALPRDRLAASPHWRRVHEDGGAQVYRLDVGGDGTGRPVGGGSQGADGAGDAAGPRR